MKDKDTMDRDIVDVEPHKSLRTWGWISYALHLVVAVGAVVPGMQASVALLLLALIIDIVKRPEATGTWQASHFGWRIRSVVWAGVLYLVTSWLWLLLIVPGFIAWGLISLWFLYRIVKGMARMNAGRAMESSNVV